MPRNLTPFVQLFNTYLDEAVESYAKFLVQDGKPLSQMQLSSIMYASFGAWHYCEAAKLGITEDVLLKETARAHKEFCALTTGQL
jgi:hypothetical protein